MRKSQIPKTDLYVSKICLGTMTFGTPVNQEDATKIIHHALDNGINFIDTANMYEGYERVQGSSGGVAEEIIGKALIGRRDKVVLATKVGMCVGKEQEDKGTSPKAIRKHLDQSLKRLNTDVIDIYYLHSPDPDTPLISTLSELDRAITQGKIRYYGISNYSAQQLNDLLVIADENMLPRPVICQPPLSLLKKDALYDLLPLCKQQQIAVAPYQILQGGILTGKYRRGGQLPESSRKAEKSEWVWNLTDELFEQLEEIEFKAKKEGFSMTQYAIHWILSQPAVVSTILGIKRISQLEEAILALN